MTADAILQHCRILAAFSEEDGYITRPFLCRSMYDVHRYLSAWMERLGMAVTIDGVGNVRGYYPGRKKSRLLIGSHVDTVPHAGAYDGVLGVVLGLALVESLAGRQLNFGIEVIAFSEEEGVRFKAPFIGSKALIGALDEAMLALQDAKGITIARAIEHFGLDPGNIPDALLDPQTFAYFEMHIEQGPVLESLDLPLGVVSAIAGQSRAAVNFYGEANHAGTTPMHLRHDALAAAAQWIVFVEEFARSAGNGLVATVGNIQVSPGAGNIVPGEACLSLDVRHTNDAVRTAAVSQLKERAQSIAGERNLTLKWNTVLDQSAVPCDTNLTRALDRAVSKAGQMAHIMPSGAGHDAMIVAAKVPIAMLFLRSPGGISHNPEELVLTDDVEAALSAGMAFLEELENQHA